MITKMTDRQTNRYGGGLCLSIGGFNPRTNRMRLPPTHLKSILFAYPDKINDLTPDPVNNKQFVMC